MDLTIDTSAVMAVTLGEPLRSELIELTRNVELMSAPTLPWEVGNALSALFRRNRIGATDAHDALAALERIPLRLVEIDLTRAVMLAHEHGIYAYDAYVLECARRHRTPLLSLDAAQQDVARALGIDVIEVQ
ncbi:MAG: type II toxin-antitoxin system VapC family toxin [Gemmatimonadota bacterium]|nr:type II toxin-antitoxin system VapC family toxin [Gemmatimonadota bacterium]